MPYSKVFNFSLQQIIVFSVAIVTFSLNPIPAHAKLSCDTLGGTWSGRMTGLLNGSTSMTLKPNCRLRWKLPDGRINNCRYKEKAGMVEYSCSLGSRGIVQINGNRITMKNVYTAPRHGAYTVNFSKTGN